MLKTVNASATVASSSIPPAFHFPSQSVVTVCSRDSDNYFQKNIAKKLDKHNVLRRPSINPECKFYKYSSFFRNMQTVI